MKSHIHKVYACLAVTCHLHFWQNGRGLLRDTAVTRGWIGYRNKSQHRKSTLKKRILPPLLQGFEPATFNKESGALATELSPPLSQHLKDKAAERNSCSRHWAGERFKDYVGETSERRGGAHMGHSVDRFKGDVGETSEKRGGAHMGHSVNRFKGDVGETSERGGGVHMGHTGSMESIWAFPSAEIPY